MNNNGFSWLAIYTAVADAMLKAENPTVSRRELLFMRDTMFPGNGGSQSPTDFRGTFDAEGNAVKSGTQATQYRTLLFVGAGDTYTAIPPEKRNVKPTGRGLANISTDELTKALAARGIVLPTA